MRDHGEEHAEAAQAALSESVAPAPRTERREALKGLVAWAVAAAPTVALSACGGGGGGALAEPSTPPTPSAVGDKPATRAEAVRFLNQATLGVTPADIDRVMTLGYSAWLDEHFAMPVQHDHVQHVRAISATRTDGFANRPEAVDMNSSMWIGMMKPDLLRQRVMFALSQVFVVSIRDGGVGELGTSLATYVNMLYQRCFGNWRELIENVTLSTAIGCFLSHAYNRKENPATGAVPDQNYARELMQLFSIGLWELNRDGTRKKDAQGQDIPTYDTNDIVGVSRVLTGWTFDAATDANWANPYTFWAANDQPVQGRPMQAFPAYHSTSQKQFLGVTIPATTTPDPVGNLRILLDTIFNHPNTAPFFCKQLIQRLVTSNPSAGYVQRVVGQFENNSQGVRGDLRAVIKAILLDPEARNDSSVTWNQFGRVREQILRMCNIMRTFRATTDVDPLSFRVPMWTYDRSHGLWQTPLGSPTVFNFYFPDYKPPNSAMAAQGLVSPEMQIVTQASVADTQFFFLDVLQNGGIADCCGNPMRNTFYMRLNYSSWLPLVSNPGAVADQLNEIFMAGQMSAQLRSAIIAGINARNSSGSETSGMTRTVDQIKLAEAVSYMLLSPEYVVQK